MGWDPESQSKKDTLSEIFFGHQIFLLCWLLLLLFRCPDAAPVSVGSERQQAAVTFPICGDRRRVVRGSGQSCSQLHTERHGAIYTGQQAAVVAKKCLMFLMA